MSLSVRRLMPKSDIFLSHCIFSIYRSGDIIIDVNQTSSTLFYILVGKVKICLPCEEQETGRIQLATLYTGDFFGELGLLTDQKQRSAQVLAEEDCAIAEIDYDTFSSLTHEHNDILLALSVQLADKLSATSRRLSEFIVLEQQTRKVCSDHEEEIKKLLLDPLTQVANRQAYTWHIDQEFSRWQRYHRPISLAVCDIDFFKKINDAFGHLAGDNVLHVVAKMIKKRLRTCDFIARYGGEEFVVILPETSLSEAFIAMNSVRELVEHCPLVYEEQSIQVTISCGVTQFLKEDETFEHIFKRADQLLYQAKESGRNLTLSG